MKDAAVARVKTLGRCLNLHTNCRQWPPDLHTHLAHFILLRWKLNTVQAVRQFYSMVYHNIEGEKNPGYLKSNAKLRFYFFIHIMKERLLAHLFFLFPNSLVRRFTCYKGVPRVITVDDLTLKNLKYHRPYM